MFNPFLHNLDFQKLWKRSLLKIMLEKKEMAETIISSYSCNVFYPIKADLVFMTPYPFPKRQILDSSKLKEFADDNLMKMTESYLKG